MCGKCNAIVPLKGAQGKKHRFWQWICNGCATKGAAEQERKAA